MSGAAQSHKNRHRSRHPLSPNASRSRFRTQTPKFSTTAAVVVMTFGHSALSDSIVRAGTPRTDRMGTADPRTW